ncbi:Transposable element Hobo transposase, partial [Frankliniella fusca]
MAEAGASGGGSGKKGGKTNKDREEEKLAISKRVINNELKFKDVTPNKRSGCWKKFQLVVTNDAEEKDTGFVHCRDCGVYSRNSGTSGLNRHECALVPSESNSTEGVVLVKVKAHPTAKNAVLDATAEFCASDLRALSIVEGDGFRALAQTLILVGERFGKVDVQDLLSSPKTIKRRIHELAETERADLYPRVQAAAEAGELGCTLDMWLEDSKKISIMTCNVCFPQLNVETNEWEAKTYVFFTEPFPKDQAKSAENLRAFIIKMFAERGIPENNLGKVCFVTDGEAALKNALSDWWREYCSAHAYNIVHTHTMTVAPRDFQSLPPRAEAIAKQVEEVVADLRKLRTGKLGKAAISQVKLVFPKSFARSNCVSFVSDNILKIREALTKAKATNSLLILNDLHLGNLVSLKTYMKDLEEAVGRIGHTSGSALPAVLNLTKLRDSDTDFMREIRLHLSANENILVLRVLHLRDSCNGLVSYMKATGQMEDLTTSLKPYMEVRWNSFHRMLESIQKVYTELLAFFERKNQGLNEKDRITKLEAIDKDLLDDLICLLTPMKVESELLQAKYSVTASLPLVSYHKLRAAYSPQESDTSVVRVMRARLFRELEQVVKVTMTHKLATFLEPSFRSFRNLLTEEEKTKVHDVARELIAELGPADPSPDDPATAEEEALPPPTKRQKSDPYAAFRDEIVPVGPIGDKVKAYLDEPLGEHDLQNPKPLAWWSRRAEKFPRLARLARRYLVVPATSAESERTFSDAGWTLNKRRKNLEMGVLDDLLFLHCNFKEKIRTKLQRLR